MKNVCEKCKHYQQHYILSEKFGFKKIDGHCMKLNAHKRYRKVGKLCEAYEPLTQSMIRKEKKESSQKTLLDIQENLQIVADYINIKYK